MKVGWVCCAVEVEIASVQATISGTRPAPVSSRSVQCSSQQHRCAAGASSQDSSIHAAVTWHPHRECPEYAYFQVQYSVVEHGSPINAISAVVSQSSNDAQCDADVKGYIGDGWPNASLPHRRDIPCSVLSILS